MLKRSIVLLFILSIFNVSKSQEKPFFSESFDDAKLESRGWYDGTTCRISSRAHNGEGCVEFEWIRGVQLVRGTSAQRHLFTPSEEVYVRYYLRLSEGWKWSGVDWHPHLTHFMTTENSEFHGPAASHLTLYIEPVNGRLRLGATDIQNEKMPHGLTQGPLKGGYNGKLYDSREILFKDDKWHCIEAYFRLNTIDQANDSANSDGIIKGWFDGKLVTDRTDVILRSADFPEMKFNQFLIAPYFGPGLLDNAQKLWIDDMVVAGKRPE